jgi:hypothetical protein
VAPQADLIATLRALAPAGLAQKPNHTTPVLIALGASIGFMAAAMILVSGLAR